jgi:hypothetical protein
VIQERATAEIGRVHENLAESRVAATVEVLEVEDPVLSGLLAGEECDPGRSRDRRAGRAQAGADPARGERRERGHRAARGERVDDVEGGAVEPEDQSPVPHHVSRE